MCRRAGEERYPDNDAVPVNTPADVLHVIKMLEDNNQLRFLFRVNSFDNLVRGRGWRTTPLQGPWARHLDGPVIRELKAKGRRKRICESTIRSRAEMM